MLRWRPVLKFSAAFVETGDTLKIDTRTGEYMSRAKCRRWQPQCDRAQLVAELHSLNLFVGFSVYVMY